MDPSNMSQSTKMLFSFRALGMPVYGGTVPKKTRDKNRAANKRARRQRKVNAR